MNAWKLLNQPPVKWQDEVTALKTDEAHEIVEELEAVSIKAAALAVYVGERRGTNGCGDRDHSTSVKEYNKMRAKIRKALGFTYPKGGEFKF